MLAYVIWHIWKERGRHIFQNASIAVSALVAFIKADLELVRVCLFGLLLLKSSCSW
jgi:hypothetical protein